LEEPKGGAMRGGISRAVLPMARPYAAHRATIGGRAAIPYLLSTACKRGREPGRNETNGGATDASDLSRAKTT